MATQLRVLGNNHFEQVVAKLNQAMVKITERNPNGYMDEWDQRMDNIGCDIAQEMGGHYDYRDTKEGHVMIFWFYPANEECVERMLKEEGIAA